MDRNLKEGDLLGMVSVRMSTELIETGFHQNRALLIAFAIGTTVLILAGSYLIIRYVIVKPVKHLKDVSEAIAVGRVERPQRNPDRRRVRRLVASRSTGCCGTSRACRTATAG